MQPTPPKTPLFPYTTLFRSISRIEESEWEVGALDRRCNHERANGDRLRGSFEGGRGSPRGNLGIRGRDFGWNNRCRRSIRRRDRKSTRLNSSHSSTSYAVFC